MKSLPSGPVSQSLANFKSALHAVNHAVSPGIAKNEGSAVAYQAVAQATSMAVQDATDYLRNISVIAATTVAVASAKMIEQETTTPWSDIITTAQDTVNTAAATFATIGGDAAVVLAGFAPE